MIANKRGQELTLGTIILIVLGVVVLIFLIYGFSTGWTNLWQRITGLGGGKVNVDTIRTACTLACDQGQSAEYSYCTQKRDVVIDGDYRGSFTCNQLEDTMNFVKGTTPQPFQVITTTCGKINCPA